MMNRSMSCFVSGISRHRKFSSITCLRSNLTRRHCQWSTFRVRQNRILSQNARWLSSDEKTEEKEETASIWIQLQSQPNILTLTRMASTPLLAYWVVHENYTLAIWGCAFAALSDYLDGYLAKHHGGSTVVGSYLDPIADKFFINTLALSLWYSGVLPTPLVIIWATKDMILLSATAWNIYKKHKSISIFTASVARQPLQVMPSTLAKVNTALQFTTLGVGILTPMVSLTPVVLESLCWMTGLSSIGTLLTYAGRSGMAESITKRQ